MKNESPLFLNRSKSYCKIIVSDKIRTDSNFVACFQIYNKKLILSKSLIYNNLAGRVVVIKIIF